MISNILIFFKEVCIYLVRKSILVFHESNVELIQQKDNFKGAKIRTVKNCII